jgi:putative protease
MFRPEIMSPAGHWPQLEAAVEAGADAVYFGLRQYTARSKVGFEREEVPAVMKRLRAARVKGYLTLNTLVWDDELSDVADTIAYLAEQGVDALIVQDPAVLQLARLIAPELPLHASTQMTVTDVHGVEMVASWGVRRVVLARELSLTEIAAIRAATNVELELFVHGALCVSYSGQCYSSEAWGGRSANRGACAQACRLPYQLEVDGSIQPLKGTRYLLSPGDLYALEILPEILALGVHSLKIEGRYKDAQYVGRVTAAYRRGVDELCAGRPNQVSPLERMQLEQVFSRGMGPQFLSGTNHQSVVLGRHPGRRGVGLGQVCSVQGASVEVLLDEQEAHAPLKKGDGVAFDGADHLPPGAGEEGGRIYELQRQGNKATLRFAAGKVNFCRIAPGDRLFRTSDHQLETQALPKSPARTYGLVVELRAQPGKQAWTRWSVLERPDLMVELHSRETLQPARQHSADEAGVRAQWQRLGGTPFVLQELRVHLQDSPFLPASLLNRLRQQACHSLLAALLAPQSLRHENPQQALASLRRPAPINEARPERPGIHLLVRNQHQLEAALALRPDSISLDYLDLVGLQDGLRTVESSGIPARVCSPRILNPGEQKITTFLLRQKAALLVRPLGLLLQRQQNPNQEWHGDFSLNAASALSAQLLLNTPLRRLTPSHDLNAAQLLQLAKGVGPQQLEVVVYQHMPVFHTEHCIFCRFLSAGSSYFDCGRPCETHQVHLLDEQGRRHGVVADVGCRNTVFAGEAQTAARHLPSFLKAGIAHWRLEFSDETPQQVQRVVGALREFLEDHSQQRLEEAWRRVAPLTEGSLFVPGVEV